MKRCSACQIEKSEINFYKSSRSKDKLHTQCKECANNKSKMWRQHNPEKIKESWKKGRQNKKVPDEFRRRRKTGMSHEEVNAQNRNHYDLNREEISHKRKQKIRTPEIKRKAREQVISWRKENKEKYNEYQRKFKSKNRTQIDARRCVYYAVKGGILIKPLLCEICGENKPLQGHHEDYTKPLEVKWLCRTCHCQQHNKLMDI